MRKTPTNRHNSKARATRVCRVAYILNNHQPVRSTIIGDQPLFYMDYEGAMADEFADEDFDIAAIEAGIEGLHQKIMGSSMFAAPEMDPEAAEERLTMFSDDIRMAALPGVDGEIMIYEDPALMCATLAQSRMAATYLEFAQSHGIEVMYSQQVPAASYDREAKIIYVNPTLPRSERLLLTARELRRVWQHKNGALLHPLTFHPDQAILVNRAQIADLSVAMVRMAWELQLSGEKDVWDRVENGALADLARAFARESFIDFRTLNNGVAASAVFEAWFLSERCRFEDRKLIQQMLADYQGYVFDGDQSSQQVTAELIAALGSVPFGKNYLAQYVTTIMGDALFTDVRDRSNANFLWFIKFERSFREAEQELQSGMATDGGATATDRSHKNKRIGDTHEEAAIITLPFGQGGSPGSDQSAAVGGGGAQIISFQRNATKP
ncbi:MAG: hypothetical protein KKA05_08530 [Alphaproteobacteria bacterium]|nr:hypothetical protein [Alphaproteobacteria bacterium]MBU0858677.1 hypothetical protein [Alphaproteobacteria bacterium]